MKTILSILLAAFCAMSASAQTSESQMKDVKVGKKIFHVYNYTDSMKVYKPEQNVVTRNCFFVIAKSDFRLYVYEKVGNDTLLVAHYPVCYAQNPGNKQRVGDKKTPESSLAKPFKVSQIQPASSWKHDFGDGRGNIKSYGDWFLRLLTPGHSGIGIHGSTNNEASVPGRDSEGCIRLRDNDIKHLKEHYTVVGTPVIIRATSQGKYSFEIKAQRKLDKAYIEPKAGYTLPAGASWVSTK